MVARSNQLYFMSKAEKKVHIENLDVIKGISCFCVIALHVYAYNFDDFFYEWLKPMLDLAVPLFFTIASFLTFYSLQTRKTVYSTKQKMKYFIYKIAKMLPTFYLAMIIAIVLREINNYFTGIGHFDSLNVLFDALLVHGFSKSYMNTLIRYEWFISYVIIVYFWTILLSGKVNKVSTSAALLLISFVVSSPIIKCFKNLWGGFFIVRQRNRNYLFSL